MKNTLAYYITMLRKDFTTFCNERLNKICLSQGLLFFLIYIGKHPECSIGDLSEGLNADSGHTTRSIDKLVQSDFVIRKRKANDKRASQLSLTEKGQGALKEIYDMFNQWDEEILRDLSPENRETLLQLISTLVLNKSEGCIVKNKE